MNKDTQSQTTDKASRLDEVLYNPAELRHWLRDLVLRSEEADSHSDYDWILAEIQERAMKWPRILDENGSL